MSLGENIRSLRTERNMSQNDLAQSLNVSRQSISKWETDGATPDLDKLVGISEIFGVTLDELIKGGAAPTGPKAPADEPSGEHREAAHAPHKLAGIILLCCGAVLSALLLFLGGGLFSLLAASPFLICGVICLLTHQRTGLWCGWAVCLCIDLYLRYATGITWQIILLTARFTAEMNYTRLAIGWVQFLTCVLLIALTVRSYRTKTAPCDRKHLLTAGAQLALFAALGFAQSRLLSYILSRPDADDSLHQSLCFWVHAGGDYMRLWLLTALLVGSAALLRQYRSRKKRGQDGAPA